MKGSARKLPIGIQDFEKLRSEGYIYVDKTEYIYRLIQSGTPLLKKRSGRSRIWDMLCAIKRIKGS